MTGKGNYWTQSEPSRSYLVSNEIPEAIWGLGTYVCLLTREKIPELFRGVTTVVAGGRLRRRVVLQLRRLRAKHFWLVMNTWSSIREGKGFRVEAHDVEAGDDRVRRRLRGTTLALLP